jgi:hypothetical protein
MKTMVNRITLHFICIVILPLCLLALSGCDELESKKYIVIVSPADISSFESGDSITFEMLLTVKSREGNGRKKGTIIQWTSDRDGDLKSEEVDQDIKGDKSEWRREYTASYSQSFSTSALSAGDHKITCKAVYDTIEIATKSIRISVTESQTSSTTTTATDTTTTTDGGGNLDVTACTALDDLEVRAGEPEYSNNKTDCISSIILKNNGMRPIQVLLYVENTIEHKQPGWVSIYLELGQEWNSETIPFWAYDLQTDGIIKTSNTTAVYLEDGCLWILNDTNDGVLDAPIRTRDISGLNPCK